ncbi:MAG: phenylacetate--CoA ligase, partial [Clostridiales bacterium]|nr:phenylacetate--CoA ligase [Clostridiales bacterium]
MTRQTEWHIWNPASECMPRERLREIQGERLRAVVRRVYENVPLYRDRMQQKGLSPFDINTVDDLKHLPFTEKTDLRDQYPFGLFAAPRRDIVRIQGSSGTTGKPIVAGYTARDVDMWAELMARTLAAAGATQDDTVQVAYGYGLFTGGLGAHQGASRIGAMVLPMSSGNTQRQVMLMQDLGVTILCCTPSYAMHLGETIRDMGIRRSDLRLRAGAFGAEPWTE